MNIFSGGGRLDGPTTDSRARPDRHSDRAGGRHSGQQQLEASRCLSCKKPSCITRCPVSVPIDVFITAIKEKDYTKAVAAIKTTNLLPAVCGRVCPQE